MVLENEFPFDERVEKEAISLINAGHTVYIACATLQGKPSYEIYKGIHICRKKTSTFIYKKARVACLTLPFYFSFWNSFISEIIKKESFDFIHIHDLPLAKVGMKIANKYNIQYVVDFHENYPDMLNEESYVKTFIGKIVSPIFLWRRYESKILKKINNAIVVCKEMGERINNISPINNTVIIENVIDIKRWPEYIPEEKDDETLNIVYVGGMTRKRGIETAIEGIAIYNKTASIKAHLHIYGSGKPEYISSLMTLAQSNNVSKYVHFEGYLKLPEEANKLTKYDLGVIPHLRSVQTDNSSPNKLYQYLRYKLPVMCADCLSLVRVIEEVNGGCIYKAGDVKDFSVKLKLFTDKSAINEWGESGQKGIFEKYNWQETEKSFDLLYKKK